MKNNIQVFEVLLEKKALLDLQSEEGYPALWYALQDSDTFSMAEKLIRNGASSNIVRKIFYLPIFSQFQCTTYLVRTTYYVDKY